MMNRRNFLRGIAASPIAIAAVSLSKEAVAKPRSKIQMKPETEFFTTVVSACVEPTVFEMSAWKLES